jgi:hypothetical protein
MDESTIAEQAERWNAVGEQIMGGFVNAWIKSDISKTAVSVFSEVVGKILGTAYILMAPIGSGFAQAMSEAEDHIAPAFSEFAAQGVNDIFGTSISAAEFTKAGGRGKNENVGNELGRAIMAQLRGTAGELTASDAAAAKFVNALAGQAVEDWFKGWFFEVLSSLIPQLDVGKIENYGALGDKVANVLGISRVARQVLSPIVDTTIVTPLKWKTNLEYRPELLSASVAVAWFLRGKKDRGWLDSELGRQGWSAERIDALVFNATAKLTTGDVRELVELGIFGDIEAKQRLIDNGLPADIAGTLVQKWKFDRLARYDGQTVSAAMRAYADREISSATFHSILTRTIDDGESLEAARIHADLLRELNVKHLSHGEIRECVVRGILSRVDYRRWLEREGYAPDDALALELLLDSQIHGQVEAEKKRREAEEERAREKAEREEEKRKRDAELAERRARTFPGLADYERAVIIGALPIDAYADRLAVLKYAPDDIAFMVTILAEQRDAYLERLEKKAAAENRLEERRVSLADLERAVVRGITSIDTYVDRLRVEHMPQGDIDVLVGLLRAELDDRARADEKRREAAERLADRGLSLGQVERAVRQGLVALDDYRAWLLAQGFDQAEAALLHNSLAREMAEAEADAATREKARRLAAARGIGLAALEQAVKLGVRTIDDYAAKLIALEISTEDQVTLMGILRAELMRAENGRQIRAAGLAADAAKALTRSEFERAVKAGIRTFDEYRAFLADLGYGADDAEALVELTLLEYQHVQRARARAEELAEADATRELARADVERAVKKGVADLASYAAFVASLGYDDEDAALLVALLDAELAGQAGSESQ